MTSKIEPNRYTQVRADMDAVLHAWTDDIDAVSSEVYVGVAFAMVAYNCGDIGYIEFTKQMNVLKRLIK